VITGDFNVKSVLWGSPVSDRRGLANVVEPCQAGAQVNKCTRQYIDLCTVERVIYYRPYVIVGQHLWFVFGLARIV